ncbi:MAG: gfo/Idh/MocA family oxidoreductase, partial [Gammaproteobacteria bacterium]
MTWLIGTGPMAIDHAKVMAELCDEFVVIGRGEKSAMIFKDKTGIQPVTGGIDSYINTKNAIHERAVVAV